MAGLANHSTSVCDDIEAPLDSQLSDLPDIMRRCGVDDSLAERPAPPIAALAKQFEALSR